MCARLVNLSTTTQNALFPRDVSGMPLFMSMAMISNGISGIAKGTLTPGGLVVRRFERWQASHDFTNDSMSFFMLIQ
jgi:hypothetical protein